MALRYNFGCETERKCRGVRSSAAMGDMACRQRVQRWTSGPVNWVLAVFRGPLEGGGKKKRDGGVGGEASTGATLPVVAWAKGEAAGVAEEGAGSSRIAQRPVDVEAGGPSDREAFRSAVPPGTCMEGPPCVGVELSEAGAPREGEGRRGHRALAQGGVAPYKKTRERKGVALFSSTRAGSCSSPLCAGHGPLRERRPFFVNGNVMIGCR